LNIADLEDLPASYSCDNGTTIDGLWATAGIIPTAAGISESNDFPSDRGLWMDVQWSPLDITDHSQIPDAPPTMPKPKDSKSNKTCVEK
jgi:hypothetical protein